VNGIETLVNYYKKLKAVRKVADDCGVDYIKILQETKVFLIESKTYLEKVKKMRGLEISYQAPFPIFSCAVSHNGRLSGFDSQNIDANGDKINVYCVVAGPFGRIGLLGNDDRSGYGVAITRNGNAVAVYTQPLVDFNYECLWDLPFIFSEIISNNTTVGRETVNLKYSTRVGKKIKHLIKDHVYLVAKKEHQKSFSKNRIVNWSHKFEVRGHWRYYKREGFVGYDQIGNREPGRTWVKPSVRGSGELIKKTRIMK